MSETNDDIDQPDKRLWQPVTIRWFGLVFGGSARLCGCALPCRRLCFVDPFPTLHSQ